MEFSKQIREGTQSSHRSAESSDFIVRYMRGNIELDEFRRMNAALYLVYVALEEEQVRHRDHLLVAPLCFPALFRAESLRTDLRFLYGPDWEEHLGPSPAGKAYIDRIRWVGDNDPVLLVAHLYTRYLGDLSGGQMLARVARKTLETKGGQGMSFYVFDEVSNPKEFKNMYRRRMDELPLDESQRQAIIDEANHVFALNQGLFSELD